MRAKQSCGFAMAEDDLFQQHAPELAETITQAANSTDETQRCFADEVRKLQKRVARQGFAERRRVYRQQRWLDRVLTTIAEPSVQPKSTPNQGEAA